MPCIEPTRSMPPRGTHGRTTSRLAMAFLSKITDGHHHAGHYLVPRRKPVAVIAETHDKRLKSASEALGSGGHSHRELSGEANTRFLDVHRVSRNQEAARPARNSTRIMNPR